MPIFLSMHKDFLKPYDHSKEKDVYKTWEKGGFFDPDKSTGNNKKNTFSIIMPPPNANGSLHVGHAVGLTIQDLLIRYNRMRHLTPLFGFPYEIYFPG